MTLGYLAIPYFPPHSFMFLALILSFLMVGTFKLKKM